MASEERCDLSLPLIGSIGLKTQVADERQCQVNISSDVVNCSPVIGWSCPQLLFVSSESPARMEGSGGRRSVGF